MLAVLARFLLFILLLLLFFALLAPLALLLFFRPRNRRPPRFPGPDGRRTGNGAGGAEEKIIDAQWRELDSNGEEKAPPG